MKKEIPDISLTTVAIAAFVILIGVMLLSGSQYKDFLDSAKTTFSEAPLEKNTGLQIRGGETYVYSYEAGNQTVNMTFKVGSTNYCTVVTYAEGNDVWACINPEGNDRTMANYSLSSPLIIFFRPWMLAVDENWKWSVSMNMAFDDFDREIMDIEYRTVRTEEYRGRKAYVVKVESSDGLTTFIWIDAEKRILLKEIGEMYTVELISGLQLD